MKQHLNLPEGQRGKEPGFKGVPDLPHGGREREGHLRDMPDLPQGQRAKREHMKDIPDLPQGSREREAYAKGLIELPQGGREKEPYAKGYVDLPGGSREREPYAKGQIDLPDGQRERQSQAKNVIDLPTGQRERQIHLRELPTLPEGNKQRQPDIRDIPGMPEGNKEPSGPDLKENFELPQQDSSEHLTGGMKGLADPLSPVTRPLGFLSEVKNMVRADKTAAETRPGRVAVGAALGTTRVLGMVPFYYGDAKTGVHQHKKLIAGTGTTWKVWDGSWANLLTGLTADRKFEGAMMDDHLFLTNGADPVQSYDGTTITDLAGSPPESPFIAEGYRRLYLVDLPHQVVVCNPADPENWSTEDSAALTISGKDGDIITWLQFYRTNLYIWKRHSLHELHGPELGQVTKNWRDFRAHKVGTPNGRTIAEVNGTLFWLSDSENSKGIVTWTGGGPPQLISDPIKGIIDRINWGIISCASAGTDGFGNYLLSVPLDSAVTPTHTIVYCSLDGSWWMWEGWVPSVYGKYRLHGYNESAVFGDNNGTVYQIDGTTDAGSAIAWETVVGPAILGSATQEKRVRRAYTIVSGSQAELFTLDLDGATGGNYKLGNGKVWTGDIAHNANAATIQAALEVVYGASNVTVSGLTITFLVTVGASNLVADFSGLTKATPLTPTLTQTCQQFNAATSPADVGAFDTPQTIDITNTRTNRVKKYLPLNAGDDMGGYLYRLKLSGSGAIKFYEVGFEVGVRRV